MPFKLPHLPPISFSFGPLGFYSYGPGCLSLHLGKLNIYWESGLHAFWGRAQFFGEGE